MESRPSKIRPPKIEIVEKSVHSITDLEIYLNETLLHHIINLQTDLNKSKEIKKNQRMYENQISALLLSFKNVCDTLRHNIKLIGSAIWTKHEIDKLYTGVSGLYKCVVITHNLFNELPLQNNVGRVMGVVRSDKSSIANRHNLLHKSCEYLNNIFKDKFIDIILKPLDQNELNKKSSDDKEVICSAYENQIVICYKNALLTEFCNPETGSLAIEKMKNLCPLDENTGATLKKQTDTERDEFHSIVATQKASLRSMMNAQEVDTRGQRLDKKYRLRLIDIQLTQKIADGSMGSVFLGTCINQPAIIKKLEGLEDIQPGKPLPGKGQENTEKSLFNEIKAITSVPCKYVIQVYGYIWEKNFKCLVMEYMEKGTLYNYIDEIHYTFNMEQKHELATGIATGLLNLHIREMVHGNLNSHNVLLDKSNTPKLTDFSCVQTHTVTMTSVMKNSRLPTNSLEWMSPESLKGKPTKESDIYSLGMILWEIFTGKHPYHNLLNSHQHLYQTRNNYQNNIINIIELGQKPSLKDLPEPIQELLDWCLQHDAASRPSIDDVLSELYKCKRQLLEEEKAYLANEPQNAYEWGMHYLKKENKPDEAFQAFTRAAELNYFFAYIELAKMHFYGIGTARNSDKALELYLKCKSLDLPFADKAGHEFRELHALLFAPSPAQMRNQANVRPAPLQVQPQYRGQGPQLFQNPGQQQPPQIFPPQGHGQGMPQQGQVQPVPIPRTNNTNSANVNEKPGGRGRGW